MARIHNQNPTPNESNSIIIPPLHPSDTQLENLHTKAEEVFHEDSETSGRVVMADHHRSSEEMGGVKVKEKEENGRERLVRYRSEMAGRVCVPDIWDREYMLKDWIDCSANFDVSLVASSIPSARSALVEEAKRSRSSSGGLRIANECT